MDVEAIVREAHPKSTFATLDEGTGSTLKFEYDDIDAMYLSRGSAKHMRHLRD